MKKNKVLKSKVTTKKKDKLKEPVVRTSKGTIEAVPEEAAP